MIFIEVCNFTKYSIYIAGRNRGCVSPCNANLYPSSTLPIVWIKMNCPSHIGSFPTHSIRSSRWKVEWFCHKWYPIVKRYGHHHWQRNSFTGLWQVHFSTLRRHGPDIGRKLRQRLFVIWGKSSMALSTKVMIYFHDFRCSQGRDSDRTASMTRCGNCPFWRRIHAESPSSAEQLPLYKVDLMLLNSISPSPIGNALLVKARSNPKVSLLMRHSRDSDDQSLDIREPHEPDTMTENHSAFLQPFKLVLAN